MSQPSLPTFGDMLRRYRMRAGLTQEELARRAGMSAHGISDLERGARQRPHKATRALLIEALQLSDSARDEFEAAARRLPSAQRFSPPCEMPSTPGPAGRFPLVGRANELTCVARQLEGQGPPILLFAGEPGIGKTRLLQEATQRAQAQGWRVLSGGCRRRSGQMPFTPLLDAVESYLRQQAPAQRREMLDGCAGLVHLLPELAESVPLLPSASTLAPEQARRLMFAAVRRCLANVAGPAGTLLVLDDLQWVGSDALDLLEFLVRMPGDRPLRVIGAYRDTDVQAADALAICCGDLIREGLIERVSLAALDTPDAARLLAVLLAGVAGDAEARGQSIVRRAGGVPFYLVSYAQAIRSGVLPELDVNDLPVNVTEMIRQRVAVLAEGAREVLGVAAVTGRVIPGRLLLAVLSRREEEVLAAVDDVCRARLLVAGGEQSYAFAHDLVREVIYADLGAARRVVLHRRIAEVLELDGAGTPVELLAYHYRQSGDVEKTLHYLERAGDRACEMHALGDAMTYYRELRERLDALNRPAEAARIREKLSKALLLMARYDEALEALEEAIARYRLLGDSEGQARATASIGWVHHSRGTSEAGVERLEHFLASQSGTRLPPAKAAEICIVLSQLLKSMGRYSEQLSAIERAASLAKAIGDDRLIGQVEVRRGTALVTLGRLAAGARAIQEALPAIEAAGDERGLVQALNSLAVIYVTWGEFEQDRLYSERALEVARRLDDPAVVAFMLHRRGVNAFYRGDWLRAQDDFEQAVALTTQIGVCAATTYARIALGRLYLARGEEEAAARHFALALELGTVAKDLQSLRWACTVLAERDLLVGEVAAARARLEPLLMPLRLDQPRQERDVMQLLPLLAWLHLTQGEYDIAEAILTQIIAQERLEGCRLELVDALRMQGFLALHQERWDAATAALDESLALSRAMPYPYVEAKALYVYGLLHAARGERPQARAQLKAALVLCARLGERLYAHLIEQALGMQREGVRASQKLRNQVM